MLNIVVVAPMPRVSAMMANDVTPGCFTSERRPYRRSRRIASMAGWLGSPDRTARGRRGIQRAVSSRRARAPPPPLPEGSTLLIGAERAPSWGLEEAERVLGA